MYKEVVESYRFRYQQTTTPSATIVTVQDAKNHARIEGSGDSVYDTEQDLIIKALISAAVTRFERVTGSPIRQTDFTAYLDCMPPPGTLWLRDIPLASVAQFYGVNEDDTTEVMDSDDYSVNLDDSTIYGVDWPDGTRDFDRFRIDYTAGLVPVIAADVSLTVSAGPVTTIALKNLSQAPEQVGVITLGNLDSVDYSAWTESGGVYTFVVDATVSQTYAVDTAVSVLCPPQDVAICIKSLVAHWYQNREAANNEKIATVPMTAKAIMQARKVRRV